MQYQTLYSARQKGELHCKRKAPFRLSKDDFVTEDGDWGPKCLYAFTNGWIPGVLINARCNNHGKFLTNGLATKNITFYVTTYASKKQGKTYNMSAVTANTYAYHLDHPNPEYNDNMQRQSRLLIYRVQNAINDEQEIAGPMVMSYLTGKGDTYRSHSYTPLFWTTFLMHLEKSIPDLDKRTRYLPWHHMSSGD